MKLQEWNPLGYKTLYRELFRKHLARQDELLKQGKKVGWFFSFHPSEIIYIFDVVSAFPEQYSAYAAARGSSVDLIDASIARGFGHFLCDYFKTTVGMMEEPEKATKPIMPRPDFIVDTRALCVAHHEMAEVFARRYGIPRYTVNYPYWTSDALRGVDELTKVAKEVEELYVDYVIARLKGLFEFMERVSETPLDEEKFESVFKVSEKTSELLIKIAKLMMAKPTPGSQREIADLVFLGFFVLGSDYAYEFAERGYEIIRERVKRKVGVVPEEKFRLLTFGIMPWHSLSLYEYCEMLGATFPVNLYVNASLHKSDSKRPFESMVRRSMHFTNSTYDLLDGVVRTAKKAQLDGALLLENTGCRITSMIVRPLEDVLREEVGIPSLTLDAPQCDPRIMPLERAKTQVEAFIESLH
jgi:benzoyl-CoA reductase/2-hydroxyglutaryl-CoA dehydratase subunit BcrC/BadD/HgdB